MPGVTPGMLVGSTTQQMSGTNFIVTAGAIESHAHIGSPEQSEHALAGGTTTLVGSGPLDVGSGTTRSFGLLLQGMESSPVNYALFGRGSTSPEAVEESVAGGAAAIKIHEDWGAAPTVIDGSLIAADRNDFAVHLHTDTINEFLFAEDTMAACEGRTIHMYHVEGAGGGHAPDLLKVCSYDNVIPSSTNPTNPVHPVRDGRGAADGDDRPQPQLQHARRPAVRRGPRPRRHRRGGGFPPRHGRHLDLRHRHAGHGPPRRERRQVLATRLA